MSNESQAKGPLNPYGDLSRRAMRELEAKGINPADAIAAFNATGDVQALTGAIPIIRPNGEPVTAIAPVVEPVVSAPAPVLPPVAAPAPVAPPVRRHQVTPMRAFDVPIAPVSRWAASWVRLGLPWTVGHSRKLLQVFGARSGSMNSGVGRRPRSPVATTSRSISQPSPISSIWAFRARG